MDLARPGIPAITELSDPDRNFVVLAPADYDGVTQIRVELVVSDLQRDQDFYGDVLGFPESDGNRIEIPQRKSLTGSLD
jgi:hypothetical protein